MRSDVCGECGAAVRPGATFCTTCGAALADAADATERIDLAVTQRTGGRVAQVYQSRAGGPWGWYRSRPLGAQILIAGLAVVAALLLLTALVAALTRDDDRAQITATPSPTAVVGALLTPSPTATATPTPTPTPTPSPSPTPTPTPSPTVTVTVVVTVVVTPAPTPTPRPTPPATAIQPEAVLRAVQDNRTFMPRASTDRLEVEVNGRQITVRVQPPPLNETDTLTVASHTALTANRAIWPAFPEAQSVVVELLNEFVDQTGRRFVDRAATIEIDRETAARFQYEELRQRVLADNRQLFCLADRYRVHPAIYARIGDRGCLTAVERP